MNLIPRTPANHDWLQLGSSARRSERILLSESTLILGRGETADHSFENSLISRNHAEIAQVNGNWTIRDLGSNNGTQVNNVKLSLDPVILRDGDVIDLAGVVALTYRMTSSANDTIARTHTSRSFAQSSAEFIIDSSTRNVYIQSRLVDPPLSQKQFDILAYLYDRRNQAISKDEIALAGWPEYGEVGVGDEELKQTIYRIRSKLNSAEPGAGKILKTLRNFGYMLAL
tara:strand:- start:1921 stop:2604 length:684 start_codon:yes stop_codon:yes gene_type:complete